VEGHIVTDRVTFDGLQLESYKFGTALKETDDFTAYSAFLVRPENVTLRMRVLVL
jgi:hypothetical protein